MSTKSREFVDTIAAARASSAAGLSIAEVARILDIERKTVYNAIDRGEIPAVRFGRRIMIPRERFIAIIDGTEP